MGMPIAYEVDGTEYIAVQSGWGVDAQRIQDALAKLNIGFDPDVPQGGMVWVFEAGGQPLVGSSTPQMPGVVPASQTQQR